MSKTFTYKEENEQGWLVEKIGIEYPGKNKPATEKDYDEYNNHLTTLRRFKYSYPDPKKEMELGLDFRTETVMGGPEMVKLTGIPSRVANYTEDVAIPITSPKSEDELLMKHISEGDENELWDDLYALIKQAYKSKVDKRVMLLKKLKSMFSLSSKLKSTSPKSYSEQDLLDTWELGGSSAYNCVNPSVSCDFDSDKHKKDKQQYFKRFGIEIK